MSSTVSSLGVMTPRTLSEADAVELWPDSSKGGIDTPMYTATSTDVGGVSNGSFGLTPASSRATMAIYASNRWIWKNLKVTFQNTRSGNAARETALEASKMLLRGRSSGMTFGGISKGWDDFTLRHMEGGVYQIQSLDFWKQRQVSAKEDGSGLFRDDDGGTLWEFIKVTG
ncbi:dynamin family [Fusarium pseudoanthophilum]|uniref:Dynamin family n=1 Tax=Fusarium pseudoanthophilum TaxID=48495 RepID=A0A8H5NKS4_9HYPO|nr:dynamin family [Fusarium pseudoanthophilum]